MLCVSSRNGVSAVFTPTALCVLDDRVSNFLLDAWIHKWRGSYGIPGLRALVERQMDALRNPKALVAPLSAAGVEPGRRVGRSRSASRPRRPQSARPSTPSQATPSSASGKAPVLGGRAVATAAFDSDSDSQYSVDQRGSLYDTDDSDMMDPTPRRAGTLACALVWHSLWCLGISLL